MAISVKVRYSSYGLCGNCRSAMFTVFTNGKTELRCRAHHAHDRLVFREVVHCSEYENKNVPSEYEMNKIAWTLRTDKSGLAIGFAPPEKTD